MDANHDGVIDASEVKPEHKAFLDRVSQRYGVTIQFPLSIAKFRDAMDAYYARNPQGSSRPGGPGPGFGPPPGGPAGAGFGSPPPGGSAPGSPNSFSTTMSSPSAAGTSNAMWNSSSSGASTAGSPAATASALDQVDERIRNYAMALLKRYDRMATASWSTRNGARCAATGSRPTPTATIGSPWMRLSIASPAIAPATPPA